MMVVELIISLIIGIVVGVLITYRLLRASMQKELEARLAKYVAEYEEKIRKSALETSRAVIKGKVAEQMAPLLPQFRYNPSDARFIGSPVDLIVFDGYSENRQQINIVFVEVKTSKKPRLSKTEQMVREAIEKGNVRYEILHID